MTNICIIATIIIYLVAMLLVGFAYSKSNNDSTDFYLGGRKMGPLVTAMSAEASDMSSWLLMGMPGLAYLTGIASPGWTAIGLALGTWLNWLIVARRLRRYSANLEAITVPQFLSLRFHDQRNLLNALGAVIIIVFFVPYTASGFAACGKLFHSLFGVDYMAAMVVSACVIVGYTITGGFRAVTTTDLIQSVVMSLALVAVLTMSLLAGCAEDGMIGQAERDGRNVIEEGAQDAKNAANDAKNAVEDAADATGDMMENAQGMMMAAGSRIQDVIMELEENLGITMPEKLDQQSLQEVFGLNPDDIEEYYGEYSAVNTSADHIIGVKVKDGKVDEVKSALESHKQEIVDNFEEYLPDQYDKAQAGKIIQKGNYLFLVIAGDSEKGYDSEMNRAQHIIDGYFE